MVASAADHALHSVLFQLFLRETLSTLSMLTHVSIAVLAQLSAQYQLSHRVEFKRKIIKSTFHQACLIERAFFILHLAKPNERGNAQHFRVRRAH